ncbi:MAG: hypothetical protein NTV93_12900 [Verrucomicrobia bacterium]|nr:hypothetical protein [Verrucomicrobiota bacterium]
MKTEDAFITAGAGKTNPTLRSLSEHPMLYTDTSGKTKRMGEIVFVTTRREIQTRNIRRFVSTFGPEVSKRKLRRLHGRIILTVDGFDAVSEEVFEIPEVRNYYALLHRVWPCWLFISCLASASLRAIALSVIPNLDVVRSNNVCRIQIPGSDLRDFFMHSLPAAAALHHKAGIPKRYGIEYLQHVASYLGIPED